MYRISPPVASLGTSRSVIRVSDGSCIAMHMGNMDCRKFLTDWRDGADVIGSDDEILPYSDAAVIELGLEPIASDES